MMQVGILPSPGPEGPGDPSAIFLLKTFPLALIRGESLATSLARFVNKARPGGEKEKNTLTTMHLIDRQNWR